MAILDAIKNVAKESGYSVGTTAVTSTDVTTVQLLAMAQRIIVEMGQAYMWPKLFKSGTITMVAGQNTYALPNDISYYHHDTFWNSSTRWPLYGPLSPQDIGDIVGFGLTATTYSQFQIRGLTNNQFFVYPTPSASGAVFTFQYMSARFVKPRTWTTAPTLTAVGDFTFYNGNYYYATNAGYTQLLPPTGTSGISYDGGIYWQYYDGPYETFRFDTDEPLFSQRILEQGMMERFGEIKQLAIKPRFDDQLNEEYSRANPQQTIYPAGDDYGYVLKARSGTAVFGRPLG